MKRESYRTRNTSFYSLYLLVSRSHDSFQFLCEWENYFARFTEPRSGFRIAFNMFDTDGDQTVDKKEFLVVSHYSSNIMLFHSFLIFTLISACISALIYSFFFVFPHMLMHHCIWFVFAFLFVHWNWSSSSFHMIWESKSHKTSNFFIFFLSRSFIFFGQLLGLFASAYYPSAARESVFNSFVSSKTSIWQSCCLTLYRYSSEC